MSEELIWLDARNGCTKFAFQGTTIWLCNECGEPQHPDNPPCECRTDELEAA